MGRETERTRCVRLLNEVVALDPMSSRWRREEFLDMARYREGDFDAGIAIDWLLSDEGRATRFELENELMRLFDVAQPATHVYRKFVVSLRDLLPMRDLKPAATDTVAPDDTLAPTSCHYDPAPLPEEDPVSRLVPAVRDFSTKRQRTVESEHVEMPDDVDVDGDEVTPMGPDDQTEKAKELVIPPYLLGHEPLPPVQFTFTEQRLPSTGASLFVLMPQQWPQSPPKAAAPSPVMSPRARAKAKAQPSAFDSWEPVKEEQPEYPVKPAPATALPSLPPAMQARLVHSRPRVQRVQRNLRNASCVSAGGPRVSDRKLRDLFAREGAPIAHLPRRQRTRDGNRVFWQKIHLHSPQDVARLMAGKKKRRLPLGRRGFIQVEPYVSSHSRRRKKRARAAAPRAAWEQQL